jgi:hypothetical protein
MFLSLNNRLRAWLALADDILGHPPADVDRAWTEHPHRRPLIWHRERRAGSVLAAPAYCLCPIRPAREVSRLDEPDLIRVDEVVR